MSQDHLGPGPIIVIVEQKKERSLGAALFYLFLALCGLSVGGGILYLAQQGKGDWDHRDFLIMGAAAASVGALFFAGFIGTLSNKLIGFIFMIAGVGGALGWAYNLHVTREARREVRMAEHVPPVEYAAQELCRSGEGISKARDYAAQTSELRKVYIQGVNYHDYKPSQLRNKAFEPLFAKETPELQIVGCVASDYAKLGACPGSYGGKTLWRKRHDYIMTIYKAKTGEVIGKTKFQGPPPKPCPDMANFYEGSSGASWFEPHTLEEAKALKPLLKFIQPNTPKKAPAPKPAAKPVQGG